MNFFPAKRSLLALLVVVALLVPATLLAARGDPLMLAPPTQDDIVKVERVDEFHNASDGGGASPEPENNNTDTGPVTRDSCVIELFDECFLPLREDWHNTTTDEQASNSWWWSESASESHGYRADVLGGIISAWLLAGSSSSSNASGSNEHVAEGRSDFYGNSLGYSDESESLRRLDAHTEDGAGEGVRTLDAGASVDSPLVVDAALERERNGTRESHSSESFEASNHSRSALFGVPIDETSDAEAHHSDSSSHEAWNDTRLVARAAIESEAASQEIAEFRFDRGDETHAYEGTWDDSTSKSHSVLGFAIEDTGDSYEGSHHGAGWSEWTRLLLDIGEGILVLGGTYEHGADSGASESETTHHTGILGIGIDEIAYESEETRNTWRTVDADARVLDGEGGVGASYWDNDSASSNAQQREYALGGSQLVGYGDQHDTALRSRGVAVDAWLPEDLLDLHIQHDNTTTQDSNSTNGELGGSEVLYWAEPNEQSWRRTAADVSSPATGSNVSIFHENGTSTEGVIFRFGGTPGGALTETQATRYGADADLAHGASNTHLEYDDERITRRYWIGDAGVHTDDQRQQLTAQTGGTIEAQDGTDLVVYDAGHTESSDNTSIGTNDGQLIRYANNSTSTHGSVRVLGGLADASAERTVESGAIYGSDDDEIADYSNTFAGGSASADGRKLSQATTPAASLAAGLASMGVPAGPVLDALATANAVALVPVGDAVRVVGIDAGGSIFYADVADRVALGAITPKTCLHQGLVTSVPGLPDPVPQDQVAFVFGVAMLATCPPQLPVPILLFLASPALLYPIARAAVTTAIEGGEIPGVPPSGAAGIADSITGTLAPLLPDDATLAALHAAAADALHGAGAAVDGRVAQAGERARENAGGSLDAIDPTLDEAEDRLREDGGIDIRDTWLTIHPWLRDPQGALWALHTASTAVDAGLAQVWPVPDLALNTLYPVIDANAWPDRGIDDPDDLP